MSYLFKGATLMTLDPPAVVSADLRVEGAVITVREEQIEPVAGDEVIQVWGRIVLPGMVCAHTHLYSALARGMPAPPRAPTNFREILELIWWRLDRALDAETVYWSAAAGALEAARAGTTCLIDHHASPSFIRGSLDIVRRAIEDVGLRGVLCYEITDRNGPRGRDEGIAENRDCLEWTQLVKPALFRALVGAHASFTIGDEALRACAEMMHAYASGLHIHAAEDLCDVEDARSRFGVGVVGRLARCDALNSRTILAHGTHLDERELETARAAGVWFAHNPRSNMNNRVGYAPVAGFGSRVLLGTDGIGADMFEEARFACFKSSDAKLDLGPDYWMRVLANNQRLASELFGRDLYSLHPGAAADLIVLNYPSPTPLTAENLPWHFLFGMNSATVESVMVEGRFIVRDRKSLLNESQIQAKARAAAGKLWARMAELAPLSSPAAQA